MKRVALIVLVSQALMSTAHAASFNCAKASTNIEKMICGNAELSKLDEELNAAYKIVLQDEKRENTIKQAQKLWIKERNSCLDIICLKGTYSARTAQLLSITATSPITEEIPSGHSEWELEECPGGVDTGCNHSVSFAHLIRSGNRVCGEISEASVFREPSAWFAGGVVDNMAVVRFFDSFQSDDALPGTARIEIIDGGLNWHVLDYPKNGMIPGKRQQLRLISAYQDTTSDLNTQCEKLAQGYSKLVEAAVGMKPSLKLDATKMQPPKASR